MNLYIIIGIVVIVAAGVFWVIVKKASSGGVKKEEAIDIDPGYERHIRVYLRANEVITVDDVTRLLNISHEDAEKYLAALEKEGALVHHGEAATGLSYALAPSEEGAEGEKDQ